MRVAVALGREVHELEHAVRHLAPRRAGHPPQAQAEGDVVARAQVREQAVGLEHHAHVAPAGGHVRDVAAIEQHAAGVQPLQAGERPQRRGLAAARRPEQSHELARGEIERQAVEGVHLAEPAAQLEQLHLDAGARRGGGLGHRRPRCSLRCRTLIPPPPGSAAAALVDERQQEQQRRGQEQGGERDRDRDARIALAEQVDHHLQGVEVQAATRS